MRRIRSLPFFIVAATMLLLVGGGVVAFVVTLSGDDGGDGDERATALPSPDRRPVEGEGPTAETTGVPDDVELHPAEPMRVTRPGTVLDGLEINGGVVVDAPDVTIRNTRITATSWMGVKIESGSLLIEDSEIVGASDNCAEGIGWGNYVAVRVDISGCQDGLKGNGNVAVYDSYIHDLRETPESHNDGFQSTGGSDITIEGNTICGQFRNSVSAVKLTPERGAIDGVVIRDNILHGGNFTLYMDSKPNRYGLVTNAVVEHNRIVAGSYAHQWRAVDPDPTQRFSDNVEAELDLCGEEQAA